MNQFQLILEAKARLVATNSPEQAEALALCTDNNELWKISSQIAVATII